MSVPYVYLVGWKFHNIYYVGRQTRKGCSPDKFWKSYFTSSKVVKECVEKYGKPDIIEIRKTFDDIEKCKIYESKILRRLKVSSNDKWLNKKEGDTKWDTTGYHTAKDLRFKWK